MKASQVIYAINETMRELHTDRRTLTTAGIISAYGPVKGIKKADGQLPFAVLIQEGPYDFFWVALESVPDWKEVLVGAYRAIVPRPRRIIYERMTVKIRRA